MNTEHTKQMFPIPRPHSETPTKLIPSEIQKKPRGAKNMTWYKNFVRNGKYRGIIFEQALYLATKSKSWRLLVANCR